MNMITIFLALVVVMITPSLLHFGFKMDGGKMKTVIGIDILGFAVVMIIAVVSMLNGGGVLAAADTASSMDNVGMGYIAMAIATGAACIGAGIAVAASASAAIGAVSEDSSFMGKSLIFVALAEGIALYGLLVSFVILGKLG